MEELSKLSKELSTLENEISKLESNRAIIKYKKYQESKQTLLKHIKKEIHRIQSECNHPIWYHIKSESDYYEGRRYFTCRCLNCDKESESRARDFKNVLYLKEQFGVVKQAYINLKNISQNAEIVLKILNEKFTDKGYVF